MEKKIKKKENILETKQLCESFTTKEHLNKNHMKKKHSFWLKSGYIDLKYYHILK